jgi:tripartite-type tricarboxylate transporter receptor subunit TctC
VSLIAVSPLVLAAPARPPPGRPSSTPPGRRATSWNYGTPGVGTVAHLGMELLKAKAGIAPVHVPYPGNPQVITGPDRRPDADGAAAAGAGDGAGRGGKLQAVGVTSAGRSSVVPEVPSLADAGVQGLQLEIWNAVAAPNSLPKAHVQTLATLLAEIVRRPEIRQKILNQGWQVAGTSPEGLAKRIAADTDAMADIIRKNDIKPN